ncbi:unnamed protein product [Protopolystoma xenopodis]|uniref:Uncharacterized protein n=1 Tax=Protopolystoma xenopodis TaxID=117903 RepID=A0A448WT10_9PLAT|nr:unnamed protein product [Protopolystoma xenopodis]
MMTLKQFSLFRKRDVSVDLRGLWATSALPSQKLASFPTSDVLDTISVNPFLSPYVSQNGPLPTRGRVQPTSNGHISDIAIVFRMLGVTTLLVFFAISFTLSNFLYTRPQLPIRHKIYWKIQRIFYWFLAELTATLLPTEDFTTLSGIPKVRFLPDRIAVSTSFNYLICTCKRFPTVDMQKMPFLGLHLQHLLAKQFTMLNLSIVSRVGAGLTASLTCAHTVINSSLKAPKQSDNLYCFSEFNGFQTEPWCIV